ncbi:MAG TPA: ubiquitin-like domain-containing protein [Candidatus Saccharimonadia bacterium]|nr:ubiquitin-like domain-containing protein [Candidatus Saccharimonadia bacterium]
MAIGILITIVTFGLWSGRLPVTPSASAESQALVSLYADGQQRMFATNATTVGAVLRRSDVKLGPGDLVEPSATTPVTKGPFNINVYRARPVLVVDGTRSYRVLSAYTSPKLLAQAAGVTVYPEDTYTTGVVTNIVQQQAIGERVTIIRAKPFTVQVDGETHLLRTQAATVGSALKEAGISLGVKDTVSTPVGAPLIAGADLAITRVTEALVTLTQDIPRPVQTITDPNVMQGQSSVTTAGSDGQKTVTYRIHYTNGVETSRELVQVVSQTAPVAQVVTVGTKILFEGSVEYWRSQVEAAAAQWGIDPNMMMQIMECESNGNATDVSTFVIDGQHPTGLFQYLPTTWVAAGGTSSNIMDGSAQIQLTAKKMATQGTGAWQCQ